MKYLFKTKLLYANFTYVKIHQNFQGIKNFPTQYKFNQRPQNSFDMFTMLYHTIKKVYFRSK